MRIIAEEEEGILRAMDNPHQPWVPPSETVSETASEPSTEWVAMGLGRGVLVGAPDLRCDPWLGDLSAVKR